MPVTRLFGDLFKSGRLQAGCRSTHGLASKRPESGKWAGRSAWHSGVSASPMCLGSIQERDRASQLCGLQDLAGARSVLICVAGGSLPLIDKRHSMP